MCHYKLLLLLLVFAAGSHAEQLSEQGAIRDLNREIEQTAELKLYLGFGDFSGRQSAAKLEVASLVKLGEKEFDELRTLIPNAAYKPIRNYLVDDIPNVVLLKSIVPDRWVGLYSYPCQGGRQVVFYRQTGGVLAMVREVSLFSESSPQATGKRLSLHFPGLRATNLLKRLQEEDNKRRKQLLEKE